MRRWWILSVTALLLCLTLTGCGKEEKGEEGTEDNKKNVVLMAVGEETVSAQEAEIYLYFLKQQYEPGMGEDIWNFQIKEGETMEDYAKEAVTSHLIQLKIICQEAEKAEVFLDEEESYQAKQAAQRLLKEASPEDIERFHLEEEVAAAAYEDNALAAKYFDVATAEVDTNISDEEARQVHIQYLSVLTEGLDEKQLADAKKEVKELYKQAKETSSFLSFASSNSDSEEIELIFGKENMPEEFGQAAMELKAGEISPVIEGEKGYYIVYCITDFDEDATLDKKEAIIEAERDKLFREKYTEWSKDYKTVISTALWDEISFTQENAASEQNELQ